MHELYLKLAGKVKNKRKIDPEQFQKTRRHDRIPGWGGMKFQKEVEGERVANDPIKADFRKMYVVSDTLFARLEAYIVIPKLELNTADSAALVALRGIGPYYARKILDYRERLGGFVDAAQLLEIDGLDADRLAGFSEDVTVDAKKIRKIDLWHASDTVLARHPYIGAKGARSVLRYRQLYDSARWTLPDLAKERALPPENIEKLKKYIEIQ